MTLHRIDPSLPIDVRGELHLDAPSGRAVRLLADGAGLRLNVPGWEDLKSLGPQSFVARRLAIILAARRLTVLGLSLNIEIRGRHLLSLGRNVNPTLLSRVLGLGSVYIPVSAFFAALRK